MQRTRVSIGDQAKTACTGEKEYTVHHWVVPRSIRKKWLGLAEALTTTHIANRKYTMWGLASAGKYKMLKYDCSDDRTMSVTLKQGCFPSQSDPDFVIDRDGNIRAKITTSFSIPRMVTFEIGYYRFLIEERYEEEYIADGPNIQHHEYILFIDDAKNGGRYKLFAVPTYEEIKKFKKEFSDFTGIV